MEYQLPIGTVPFCQGQWDNQTGQFTPTDSMEDIQCCLASCKYHPQFCFDTCDKQYQFDEHHHNDCYEQCNELTNNCEDSCYSIPSHGMNIINRCAELSECGQIPVFNPSCLDEKKDDILRCCHSDCTGDQSLDCNNRCESLYDLLTQGNSSSAKTIPAHKEKEDEFNTQQKYTFWWSVLILLIVILLIVIVVV